MSSDEKAMTGEKADLPQSSLVEFLESHPPGQTVSITDLAKKREMPTVGGFRGEYKLCWPELRLHCSNELCNGIRVFRTRTSEDNPWTTLIGPQFCFVNYQCSNCQKSFKTFSLSIKPDSDARTGTCYKFGELPPFGPDTPSRLIRLIQPDREVFLKGRRCENQGLGIGAFVYYRRVVEDQKNRILEEVKKVVEKIGGKPELVSLLDRAINENQFSKAMEIAKGAIPESLLVNGHNPLSLLHSALSEGVHALSDEECLDLAGSIRVVLTELSERLGQALKDEAELTKALHKLANRKK